MYLYYLINAIIVRMINILVFLSKINSNRNYLLSIVKYKTIVMMPINYSNPLSHLLYTKLLLLIHKINVIVNFQLSLYVYLTFTLFVESQKFVRNSFKHLSIFFWHHMIIKGIFFANWAIMNCCNASSKVRIEYDVLNFTRYIDRNPHLLALPLILILLPVYSEIYKDMKKFVALMLWHAGHIFKYTTEHYR